MRKKKSEGQRRWELGQSEGREDGEWEEKGGGCDLGVALGVKHTAANKIEVARFRQTRYC